MLRSQRNTTLTASNRLPVTQLPVELAVGAKIGRYVVEKRLGAGGMGVVYEAWDTELARAVALKIVRPRGDLEAMQARLRREAKAMARLSHRNVVPVFDIATHEGQLFIAMELVAGDTLRWWVTLPRPWREVVQLFAKAGRGLEAAHAAGLLHRDFKPDNVMVGGGDEPRITDFGLARELDEDGREPSPSSGRDIDLSQITATGSLAGTPAYMAPEQLLQIESGPKADQFSFCVALFEVIYGERPFPKISHDTESRIAEIRAGRIIKPAQARGVPSRIHAAIVRGLAFDPDKRWPSMRALVSALEQGRRRRWRRFSGAVAIAAIAVVLSQGHQDSQRTPNCLDVVPNGNDAVTILVCKDEYTRTGDPRVGAKLADALSRIGNLKEAAPLATELLATTARADATYTLGKIADDEGRRDDAERLLQHASDLHREQGEWGASATDLLGLANTSNDIVDQLRDLDQGVIDARRGADRKIEGYCHITAAALLSELGVRTAALNELEHAEHLMTASSDRMWLDLKRGDFHQSFEEHALAIAAFERARGRAEAATNARRKLSSSLNLVYSLAEAARLDDAARELNDATTLDSDNRKIAVRLALEARIAARRGDAVGAGKLLDRAIAATAKDEPADLVLREVERAEVALQQGDLADAESWSRRAIARIDTLRSANPPAELRSWMITDRRVPYEILFASLARRGDAAGALGVFDGHRGLDILAGLAHGDHRESPLPGIAFPIAELATLLPPLQTSALATAVPEIPMLDAVRASSMLALVVARNELWRITADAGRLQIARVGAFSAVRPQLDQLRAAPDDRVAASVLGNLLIPVELARPSSRVLHVVLDEPLAWLPLAALRVGDHQLISARPIMRSARPADVGCAPRPRDAHRILLSNARPDLAPPISADWVRATRASLLDITATDLVHITVPTERDTLGEALVVSDGHVRALEIAGHGHTASRVILATPDAGPTGTEPLAMAFLAAGADQVIATVRPVSPSAAERLTDQLYRSDVTDLGRALARLQAASNGDDDLLGFAAFGRSICNP